MNKATLMKVLVSPHVSDKAYRMGDESNHVAFKVATWATKQEVKHAVEMLFEVEVDAVRTVNMKGKSRRFGRIEGRTKDWKKAYVKLKPGHDISFIEAEK